MANDDDNFMMNDSNRLMNDDAMPNGFNMKSMIL